MSNGRGGAFAGVRAMFGGPLRRALLLKESQDHDLLAMQTANSRLSEAAKAVIPDNDQFQDAMIATADRELDTQTGEALRQSARRAAMKSPHMKGYLGSLGRFVVGVGPSFTAQLGEGKEDAQKAIDEWWAMFGKINRWSDLEDEIPHRTWRDGEVFTRFFVQESEGPPEDWEPDMVRLAALHPKEEFNADDLEPAEIPQGMTIIRLIPPEQIQEGDTGFSHGIVTSKVDVVTVLAYLWHTPDGKALQEIISAKDVQHIKINVDQDVKRGRSQLETILKRNKQYEDWLGYRILLNLVRSAVVLVKKITGATATQVASIKNKWASERADNTRTNATQMLKPGSTVHATEGIEYDMLSPNLQASDAQHDGRSILLSEAAATGMPEYIFTGDSSNSNFASTMVSEAPAVKEFQRWQDFFEPYFIEIYRRVMVNGAEAEQIKGLEKEEAETMPITMEWPELISRNELDHTKANQLRQAAGVLSRETWAKEDGRDWATERDLIDKERQADVEFTAPGER